MTVFNFSTCTSGTELNGKSRFGLYIIRSRNSQQLYRIGSSGIHSDKTTLSGRIKYHARNTGKGNWTVENRPLDLVWAAEIDAPSSAQSVIVALECALFAHLATHFKVLTTSGFVIDASKDVVADVIEKFMPMMRRIGSAQFGAFQENGEIREIA